MEKAPQMHNEANNPANHESSESERPMTVEEAMLAAESYRKFKVASGIEEAKNKSKEIAEMNQDFISYVQSKYDGDASKVSQKEFEIWEDDFIYAWEHQQQAVKEAGFAYNDAEEAKLEQDLFFTGKEEVLHQTIEAQAGRFYRERAKALLEAIQASDADEEQKRHESDLLSNFYNDVNRHIEMKYMTPEEIRDEYPGYSGARDYDRIRTSYHNGAIKTLNSLNDLARKYHLRPFTPRNYWTSEASNQTDDMRRRMRYDRDMVEEYYSIAFQDKVKKANNRLNQALSRGY